MTELSPGWAEATLGEVCERFSKHNPADRPGEPIRYIDIGGIESQRVVEVKEFLGLDAPSRARQLVRSGDTVLSTVRTYLRKTALVPPELDGATASTGFCVLRPASGIEPAFVFYRVIEPAFVATLSELQTGSSYPAVRDTDVLSQRILLPPSDEQRRIVAAIEEHFSRLDAAEESLRRAKAKLARLRLGGIEATFKGKWPSTTLGEIAEIVGGVTKDSKRQSDPSFVKVPYLRVANVQRGYLDLSEVTTIRVPLEKARALELQAGDVLFNEGVTGTSSGGGGSGPVRSTVASTKTTCFERG